MNASYAQKQSPAQKKDASSASSVLDTSSQSESLQRKADMANNAAQRADALRPNNTGMPDNLKSGIENLSGFSMDDVRVHYNSSKPATVQALAYTQGTDIHVAPGQEKHLPHEAWHVAQQMAGRVSPTTNINGMPVNDNAVLEHEADVMGEKAAQCRKSKSQHFSEYVAPSKNTMQRIILDEKAKICYAKNDVSIKEDEIQKKVLTDDKLNKSFTSYFNDILTKLGRSDLVVKELRVKDNDTRCCWNKIYLQNGKKFTPVKLTIKAKDIAEDFDGIDSSIKYEPNNACVLQALYCAENRKTTSIESLSGYHSSICAEYKTKKGSDINYQSDMGAFLLYTSRGYRDVKGEFPDVITLENFLGHLSKNKIKKNKSYILLSVSKKEGHAVAVVEGKVFDIQGGTKEKKYMIKNIYTKS